VLAQLLTDLEGRGIKLRLEGDKLKYTAPPDAVTPEIRSQLQAHKAALIEHLANATTLVPASFSQKRFWTLQGLEPQEVYYHDPFLFKLRGALDPAFIRRCFNAMVERHEILRTVLRMVDGELMQVISPKGEVVWFETRMPGAPESEVRQWLDRESRRPFDLANACGMHIAMATVPGETPEADVNYLHLCFHNTVFDHPSLLLVLKELSAIFEAFSTGQPIALPPAAQYAEYARWQMTQLAKLDERRQYWNDWFRAGEPPAWTWSNEKAVHGKGYDAHLVDILYSPDMTRRLLAMCRRHGITQYLAIVSAYFVMMRRYTGCKDLTIGTTYVIRPDWRFENMIGPTEVVPALRVDLSDNPTLATLFARVKDVVAAALTYQDVPLKEIMRDRQGGPLFRVVFSAYPDTLKGKLQLRGLDVEWVEDWVYDQSRPDLYLITWETDSDGERQLGGVWLPKKSLFEREAADEMNEWFGRLLVAMIEDSSQTVEELVAGPTN
jgi:hypothetical protein